MKHNTPISDNIYKESLAFHSKERKGKVGTLLLKPLENAKDLSLAYSPGVAAPCKAIFENKSKAYEYTNKGNTVAVVTNGTAVLGLGNLGALASKPVMEGKVALFKKFANIDAIDIEVDTENCDEFINIVKSISSGWGGINLEDIKAPDCFVIEEKLRNLLDIPVFHDDQHGTAVVILGGIINSLLLVNKKLKDVKIVINGAGAAAIACADLLKIYGAKSNNVIICDTKGVIYSGREIGMNPWKSKHSTSTHCRSLIDAMAESDIFIGLSQAKAINKSMILSMRKNPIIFALANPEPEINPDEVKNIRDDAIIATGRSDYPNQINNVICFPYIFKGALSCKAKSIDKGMQIAAAQSIAEIARRKAPQSLQKLYGKELIFGRDYIIPVPFDNRLIEAVPLAVSDSAKKNPTNIL